MRRDRSGMTSAVMVAAGVICGVAVAVAWQNGALAQSANTRRVIRPATAPNIGLPFSPGVLAGNTLYISGHLGTRPGDQRVWSSGGVEAETRQVARQHLARCCALLAWTSRTSRR